MQRLKSAVTNAEKEVKTARKQQTKAQTPHDRQRIQNLLNTAQKRRATEEQKVRTQEALLMQLRDSLNHHVRFGATIHSPEHP